MAHETQFGTFYLPNDETKSLTFVKEVPSYSGVNSGYLAELKSYDIFLYELSEPVIQVGSGAFFTCEIDRVNTTMRGTTVILDGGEQHTTPDSSCNKNKVDINNLTFLDNSFVYESRYQAGYLTIDGTRDYALDIRSKLYLDPEYYVGEKDAQMCDANFEKNKTELREFLKLFVSANEELLI